MTWKARVPLFATALWWGSLTAIGFIAVPLLFQHLATPADAGRMAARLFSAQCWIAMGCGMLTLMALRADERSDGLGWLSAGMLLALLLEFAVAPRIAARLNLALWHPVGSAMYVAQWACAGVLLWKQAPSRAAS